MRVTKLKYHCSFISHDLMNQNRDPICCNSRLDIILCIVRSYHALYILKCGVLTYDSYNKYMVRELLHFVNKAFIHKLCGR